MVLVARREEKLKEVRWEIFNELAPICRGDQVGIERVFQVVEEITKSGGTALFKQIDVTDKAQVLNI